MSTNNHGGVPGANTPTNDEGIVTGQGNNPQKTTNYSCNFKSKIIAVCARFTGAAIAFDLLFMLLAVQFALIVWWAFQ